MTVFETKKQAEYNKPQQLTIYRGTEVFETGVMSLNEAAQKIFNEKFIDFDPETDLCSAFEYFEYFSCISVSRPLENWSIEIN